MSKDEPVQLVRFVAQVNEDKKGSTLTLFYSNGTQQPFYDSAMLNFQLNNVTPAGAAFIEAYIAKLLKLRIKGEIEDV